MRKLKFKKLILSICCMLGFGLNSFREYQREQERFPGAPPNSPPETSLNPCLPHHLCSHSLIKTCLPTFCFFLLQLLIHTVATLIFLTVELLKYLGPVFWSIKHMCCGVRQLRFQSQLCHLPSVHPWRNYSLYPQFSHLLEGNN